ncbi:hypothetical protein [Paenibacillus sp. FSL L8-0463]|uniref:hypothetical protein n=1 Tax=Paenibacillus sp. FSL L8-0463 TaxID=2954687 RepID=UPI003119C896
MIRISNYELIFITIVKVLLLTVIFYDGEGESCGSALIGYPCAMMKPLSQRLKE